MQFDFFLNVGNLWYFFQDSLINKKFKKHSIYLKYSFRYNNICW